MGNNILSSAFVDAMQSQLNENDFKGYWSNWNPSKDESVKELLIHCRKLQIALAKNLKHEISEYSSDIAVICEKIYTLYGDNNAV